MGIPNNNFLLENKGNIFSTVEIWYLSAMVTSFSCLVLWLGTLEGASALFLWFFLALAALLFVMVETDVNDNVGTVLASLFVVFIAGAYVGPAS